MYIIRLKLCGKICIYVQILRKKHWKSYTKILDVVFSQVQNYIIDISSQFFIIITYDNKNLQYGKLFCCCCYQSWYMCIFKQVQCTYFMEKNVWNKIFFFLFFPIHLLFTTYPSYRGISFFLGSITLRSVSTPCTHRHLRSVPSRRQIALSRKGISVFILPCSSPTSYFSTLEIRDINCMTCGMQLFFQQLCLWYIIY